MIAAVIFDMDGLLIDSEPLWHQAEISIFGRLGLELSPELCQPFTGVRVDEVVKHWHSQCHHPELSPEELEAQVITEVHKLACTVGKPLAGVYDIIRMFRSCNLPLAVASSSPLDMIKGVLQSLEIESFFQALCSADNEEFGKPHPAVYLSTASELAVKPEHCLAFEDSLPGVQAAKAAGMKVVAVPQHYHYDNPGFSIADLKLNSLSQFTMSHYQQLSS